MSKNISYPNLDKYLAAYPEAANICQGLSNKSEFVESAKEPAYPGGFLCVSVDKYVISVSNSVNCLLGVCETAQEVTRNLDALREITPINLFDLRMFGFEPREES